MDAFRDPLENILTRRANQGHDCIVPQPLLTPVALLSNGRFGAIAGKNPYRSLKLHLRAAANDRRGVAEPRALYDQR